MSVACVRSRRQVVGEIPANCWCGLSSWHQQPCRDPQTSKILSASQMGEGEDPEKKKKKNTIVWESNDIQEK